MVNNEIYSVLKKYDFTEYEAKIYVSLLQQHPLKGHAIAINSGVPSPKVYESLRKMIEKGIVFTISDGKTASKKLYSPLPYEELMEKLNQEFQEHTGFLTSFFENASKNIVEDWSELFHIEGYIPSIDVIKNSIRASTNQIILSGWNKEIIQLKEDLLAAHERGVSIVTIIFDNPDLGFPWKNFSHHQGPTSNSRHLGELSIVIDRSKVIILQSSVPEESHAIVSSHQAMIRTTINYIRHDIYINRVVKDFHHELTEKYGENLENLLENF